MTTDADPGRVDLDLVLAEIHAEAARLRSEEGGSLEETLDQAFRRHTPGDLDSADTGEAFARLDALTAVSIPVPDAAPRPGRAEWKRSILRGIGAVLRSNPVARLLRMATSEITAFNAAVVRLLRRIDTRVANLEARSGQPSTAVRLAADQATVPSPSPTLVAAVVGALGAPAGRVLHAGCGRGEIVAALGDAGIGAYGVDPRRALHVDALRAGLDVRGEDPRAHLAALPSGILGAVILDGSVDRLGVNEQVALLDDAVRATAPGGRIIVVLSERTGPSAVAADLAGGHRLLPATWHHLLSLRSTVVHDIDADGVTVLIGDLGA